MASPTTFSSVSSSGVHQRTTGRWCGGGPQVLADGDDVDADAAQVGQRLDAPRPSVSPMPDDERRLRGEPGGLGPGQHATASGRSRPTGARPAGAGPPSRGCGSARRGARRRSRSSASGSPLQSGISTSTDTPGVRARMARIVAANSAAPPSGRSSRATAVTTAKRRPMRSTASATRVGLARVGRLGVAGVDEAEAAGPRAALAVDHEGGGAVGPALGQVRAARLLAHRDEPEVADRARARRPTSGVSLSWARIHSGLRAEIARPSVTPASARRAARRSVGGAARRAPARRGPSPRLNGDEVLGDVAPHDVGPVGARRAPPRPPHGRRRRRRPRASTPSMPSAASDVTALSAMPHGTMCPNMAMSGSTLRAKPCIDRPAAELHADGADLAGRGRRPAPPTRRGSRAAGRRRCSPRSASTSMTSCSTEHT